MQKSPKNERSLKYRKAAVALPVALVLSSFASTSVAADDTQKPVTEKLYTPERLRQASSASADSEIAGFGEDVARSGRLVDSSSVTAAEVDDITVVWEDSAGAPTVAYQNVSGEAEGIEIYSTNADEVEPAETLIDSSGMGTLNGTSGIDDDTMVRACSSTLGKGSGDNRNKISSCFEKVRIFDGGDQKWDYWYYNRWATAEGRTRRWANDAHPFEIDMRSRTAKGTKPASLVDWSPKDSNNQCSEQGKVGLSYKGASAEVPVRNCEETIYSANANYNPDQTNEPGLEMRAKWSAGTQRNGRSEGTDFVLVTRSFNDEEPIMADYTSAKFCLGTVQVNCEEDLIRKDPSWNDQDHPRG